MVLIATDWSVAIALFFLQSLSSYITLLNSFVGLLAWREFMKFWCQPSDEESSVKKKVICYQLELGK